MAQAEEAIEDLDDPSSQEPEELERLLEATQEGEEGEGGESPPEGGKRFLFSKKFWILVGGGVLLLLLLAVGAYFFLSSPAPETDVNEAATTPTSIEPAKQTFDKINVYALQPFFLPLKANEKETGNFISVTPHFILSNSTLNKEIEKSLPTIRKNIYTILIRKSPRDYFLKKGRIKEEIKKDILTGVNPLLLAGTGTITDVVFTQFVVK